MRNSLRGISCGLAAASALGCATIINGSTQSVTITSNPPGARVTVLPSHEALVTPGEADLSRRRVHTVLFQLEGYQPATGYLDRTNSNVTLWNLVLGGVIGMSVDLSTGAVFRLTPDPLHVDLVPARSRSAPGDSTAHSD
jgi:hypothetical protein